MTSDNRFRADGTIDFPDSGSLEARIDFENREGNVLFVNGQVQPTVPIRSCEIQHPGKWMFLAHTPTASPVSG